MPADTVVVSIADHGRIQRVLERLLADASAKVVFLVRRNGEQIAAAGNLDGVDPTSLASLTAGNVAATHGLARILGEEEFSILFHEGTREHLHISVVPQGAILLVLFDQRTSLGLVRLRVKRASGELGTILEDVAAHSRAQQEAKGSSLLAGISDDDIDALFR